METNLKPFLEPRTPKRSYKQPELFDLGETRSNLLALLSKLRGYLASNTFQSSLTILNNLTHQFLKQEVQETLNSLIETYVNHSTNEKLNESLNSLQRALINEDEGRNLAEFTQRLQANVLTPLHQILELLETTKDAREVLEGDRDYAEAKAKKILAAVIYILNILNQRPLKTLSKYCHINHQNLLAALARESDAPNQNDLVEAVEFSGNKFKEDNVEGSEDIERICYQLLGDQSVANSSAESLEHTVKRLFDEIHSHTAGYSLSDANIKIDHISEVDREELRTTLRRSLEGLVKGQIEEKTTVLVHALEAHLKDTRDAFSKLKEYFQTKDESKNYQKLVDGSFEHDISETHHYELSKALNTIKIYEDLMMEIFSHLKQLEKSNTQYLDTKEYIANEVKKVFNELLESARNSLAITSPLETFQENLLLDETLVIASLHELIEKISPDPANLAARINKDVVSEKLNLVAIEVTDEYILKSANFSNEVFGTHKQEPAPFYLYNTGSQVLILQVLDLQEGKGRLFLERKEELEGSNIPDGIQRVHLNVDHELKRILELLVECHNLRANRDKITAEHINRNIVLALALFWIDAHIGDSDTINEITLEKKHLQDLVNLSKTDRTRRVPEEKKEAVEESPVVEEPQQAEPEEAKATEHKTVHETLEEKREEEQPVTVEQATEQTTEPETIQEETVEVKEDVTQEETNVNKEETTEPQSVVSEQETQNTEAVTEESKVEEQPQEESAQNAGAEEEQDEGKKEEETTENKATSGQAAAGGASKNKKKKKKK